MLTIIFTVALLWVAWKMLILEFKAAWGIVRILCTVLLLPLFLFGMVCAGLLYIAVPILIIIGMIVLICSAAGS